VLYKIFTEAIGAGPLDGGCYALAKALWKILGGELYSLSGINLKGARQAEHVVLKLGAVYWDADGCSTKGAFLKRWQEEEWVKMPELRPFKETDVSESPRDNGLIKRVVEHLTGGGSIHLAK